MLRPKTFFGFVFAVPLLLMLTFWITHIYRYKSPPVIHPLPNFPTLDQLMPKPKETLGFVTAVANVDQSSLQSLKNLVGSIHFHHPELSILIYGPTDLQPHVVQWEKTKWGNLSTLIDSWPRVSSGIGASLEDDPDFFISLGLAAVAQVAEHRERILYVPPSMVLEKRVDSIAQQLRNKGHFFAPHEGVWGLRVIDAAHFRHFARLLACTSGCTETTRDALAALCSELGCLPSADHGLVPGDLALHTYTDMIRLVTEHELPVPEPSPVVPDKPVAPQYRGKTRICMLVPSTTRGVQAPSVNTLPFFDVFFPSFLTSIAPDADRFAFTVFWGYDEGDAFYDNEANLRAIEQKLVFDASEQNAQVDFKTYRYIGMQGAPAFVWNGLFKDAYEDGCDYFYQINDDIRFETSGWATRFVKVLKDNRYMPDFGMVGPTDVGNSKTMTQSFCSRLHYDIFGTYYPISFKNWYSDDWATHIYDPFDSSFWLRDHRIRNTNVHGTRYTANDEAGEWLAKELAQGKEKILEWVKQHRAA
eukprot:gnl/Trimastix_PCT/2706.p1 GENE.gnl/Trimastix_PCT/2706~~gnl/Trimastix_PCT/2706.p1  ORF type:complete len:530 (-),score=122.77 gnl/Trimastix_PCT/2706:129-1718(-)